MTRWRQFGPAPGYLLVTLVVLALSPAVLLAGDLVNRHYLHGMRARPVRMMARRRTGFIRPRSVTRVTRRHYRRTGPGWVSVWDACQGQRFGPLAAPFLGNPVWIALTAPARWLIDRVRPLAGRGRRGNGNGPPNAGVREPRRPRPDQPAGAIALPEPH